jgi:hypothetical protein
MTAAHRLRILATMMAVTINKTRIPKVTTTISNQFCPRTQLEVIIAAIGT